MFIIISYTNLKLNLLQEYIFIALDILEKRQQNEDIIANNRLEAWLTFLGTDAPEKIIKLLEQHPEFKPLYEEVYEMCRNMEQMMGWFTKELVELDKNTVQYMIDEMQDTIDSQKDTINSQQNTIDAMAKELEKLKARLTV